MKTIAGALGVDPQPKRLSPGVYRNPNGSLGHSAQLPPQKQVKPLPMPQGNPNQVPPQMFAGGSGGFNEMQPQQGYNDKMYRQQIPQPPQGQRWVQGQDGGYSNQIGRAHV